MFFRLSPVVLFAGAVGALVWNAWFRESAYGDAVVGEAYLALYASAAALLGALFVILFPGYRPQDRYWGYVTLGLVIGFWLQR
jgi:hypothetical protein